MTRYHLFLVVLLLHALLFPFLIFPAAAQSGASWSDGMTFLGDATVKNGVLSLTSDENPSSSPPSSVPHSAGRALYSMPMRFLNASTHAPVSFSSRFTFSITALSSEDTFSGDGLALLITSDPQFLGCADGYIGLFCGDNSTAALQGGRETVGVEFDAWFNEFLGDPNGNHVAIDVGSILSVASADAGEAGVDLRSGTPVTAWVEYDGGEDSFRVWISGSGGTRRPPRPLLGVDKVGLAGHLREFMYVGFSASSSGRDTAAHLVESWSFRTFAGSLPSSSLTPIPTPLGPINGGTQPAPPLKDCLIRFPVYQVASADTVKSVCSRGKRGGDDDDWPQTQGFRASSSQPGIPPARTHTRNYRHRLIPLLSAIWVGVLLLVLAIAGLALGIRKKVGMCKRGSPLNAISGDEKGPAPLQFLLEEISQATGGFHESKILGRGATGTVYGGVLPSCGAVAVKRFDQAYERVNANFLRELVVLIGRSRHRNLVPLRGWCCERDELLLVYEYMPNGNLDKHLHPAPASAPPLAWQRRCEILLGLASAVAFLHRDCERKILHRDIKSCNVLLDAGLNARLGDLGLAELREHVQSLLQALPMGTMGYLAPEFVHSGVPTEATDVYSFGIVALEVATGRKPLDKGVALVDWLWGLHGQKRLALAADPRLGGEFDSKEMRNVLTVGLACAHPDYRQRPCMRRAIRMLKGTITTPVLPPKKPAVRLLSLGDRKLSEISAATSATVWHTPEHTLT